MEFKYPFPTLKSLSSIRICLNWADHQLGPFQHISAFLEEEALRERESYKSIDGLPISRSMKAVVRDVLFGILEQLGFWWMERGSQMSVNLHGQSGLAPEVQFFHFDAFGRFDEQRTLKPVFQKRVAKENDLLSLSTLLTEAYDLWLLPEVDAISRKMVAIASNRRQSEVLLEGPRLELCLGQCHFLYRFVKEDAAQFLKTIRDSACANCFRIYLERESIAVAPFLKARYWNFDAFKDHFDLLEPSKREDFIESVLKEFGWMCVGTKDQLDILTFLKQKNNQRNWMLKLRRRDFVCFCEDLLMWPYTSFFILAFKHLATYFSSDDCGDFFWSIVEKIPAEQQYGEVHRSLLVDYWSVLTADVKRSCVTSRYCQWWPKAMENLKVKAPFLHNTIKTEGDSLVTAANKE